MANGKRESEAVRRARKDLADRAQELQDAHKRVMVARKKFNAAHAALYKLLEIESNAKK